MKTYCPTADPAPGCTCDDADTMLAVDNGDGDGGTVLMCGACYAQLQDDQEHAAQNGCAKCDPRDDIDD